MERFCGSKSMLNCYPPYHKIINTNNITTTHCFPSAIIGLIKHGPMIIDPKLLPHPKTLLDFQAFLKNAYTKADTDNDTDSDINTPLKHKLRNNISRTNTMIQNFDRYSKQR